MKSALILIDIQNDYFEGGKYELVNPLNALNNAEKILKIFRDGDLPVIHVQHKNISRGAPFFAPDTEGVKIHANLAPGESEYLVIKNVPNSFHNTNLLSILNDNDISNVVICGMMSHMCIDTTVRAAKDLGLNVTLIEDACATRDLVFDGCVIPAQTVHNTFMASLNGMFAKVVKASEFHI